MRRTKPKAELLFQRRREFDDGAIMEMKIWQVPTPVPPTTHGLKYSLFYGRGGVRLVGYDNERGKGDHKHLGNVESPYPFSTVDQLMADFLADIQALRKQEDR